MKGSMVLWSKDMKTPLCPLFSDFKTTSKFLLLTIIAIFLNCTQIASADQITHKQNIDKFYSMILDEESKTSKNIWSPSFHFTPVAYTMHQPNALAEFNGNYHLFYDYKIKNDNINQNLWGHAISPDFIHWKNIKPALAPSESYDKDGLFDGSSIVVDGLLNLIYTGSTKTDKHEKAEFHQTQNLAISKDGINFGKSANNPIIKMAPHYSYLEFSSSNFSGPYIWQQSDRFYALVGSQFEKTKDGALLLFKSKDLRNWVFINITAIGSKGEMGYIWKNPALLHIGNDDILMFTAMGIKPQEKKYLNQQTTGWLIGKIDYDTGKFKQKGPFGIFDYGFDFYAPKIIKTKEGRYIMLAQLKSQNIPTTNTKENISGIISLPREIKIINGKIYTPPIAELTSLRKDSYIIKNQLIENEKDFFNIKGDNYELELEADLANASAFEIKFRSSSSHYTLLSYDKVSKTLKLNRDKSGAELSGEREVLLPLNNNLLKLRVFVDNSSIEVFANNGQAVLSSRIYPDKNSNNIKFISTGKTNLNYLNFYKLKSIY